MIKGKTINKVEMARDDVLYYRSALAVFGAFAEFDGVERSEEFWGTFGILRNETKRRLIEAEERRGEV